MIKRMLIPSIGAATLAAALCFTSASCERKTQAQQSGAAGRAATTVPVVLKPVRRIAVQRAVDVVGTLYGDEEAVISAKVPGRIIKLYKDVGDEVKPGEPLVQLKPNDYRLAVAKAELAIRQALAKLGLTELPPREFDVSNVPGVKKAELQARNAQERYNRGKKLFEATPPLMSVQEFEDLETAVQVAKSNYEVEKLNAQANVAEAWALKGDLDIANQRLNDATTRAPSPPSQADLPEDGAKLPTTSPASARRYTVTARLVNEGELVREITPCYRLVDDYLIKLRAKVPERYIARIRGGEAVKVNVEAYPGVDFAGTVKRVNSQIDADNRTFEIEVHILNDDHRLKPGAFARAAVQTHKDEGVTFAPQEAIITFAGVHKVFTVDKDNKAREVSIEPGEARTEDNYVEIIARDAKGNPTLKGDEPLVVSGASKLATGIPVTVRAPASTQSRTGKP